MEKLSVRKETIVYGENAGQLIFIPQSLALELRQVYLALRESKTWGELRARMPEKYYHEAVELSGVIDTIHDEDPFDSEIIIAYTEGYWPTWPAQFMLTWMPEEVTSTMGEVFYSAINGEYLFINPFRLPEVIAALEAHGYTCIEDQQLIEDMGPE